MAPVFGTSGLRGLVSELTDETVADYVRAFLASCMHGGEVWVGWDLRSSSPRIADAVIEAVRSEGIEAVRAGMVPTPALALAAMEVGAAAIMVTGSHIPADRNGLKFYLPSGEISKRDEVRIAAALGCAPGNATASVRDAPEIATAYASRYVRAFGADALTGMKIGIYEHSSASRDVMTETVRRLGGKAVPLARSETFVPVDTEAVDMETHAMLAKWCADHNLNAVISTDGDADRPMVTDETGRMVLGDVLGQLTASFVGAQIVCTPISSNTAIESMGFIRVTRTQIGSPFVIAAMEEALRADPHAKVVGYEANGGFLLGFQADTRWGSLSPLMTRDSLLPIFATLAWAKSEGLGLAGLVARLPARFTAADRIAEVDSATAKIFIHSLTVNNELRAAFFAEMPTEAELDTTDGLRVTFEGGDIVHLRPSGNAPEFRCYAEAQSSETAQALVTTHLTKVISELG